MCNRTPQQLPYEAVLREAACAEIPKVPWLPCVSKPTQRGFPGVSHAPTPLNKLLRQQLETKLRTANCVGKLFFRP